MLKLIQLYDSLLERDLPSEGLYRISEISKYPNHKIGIDGDMNLCVLIHTVGTLNKTIPTRKYEYFEMLFNQNCKILTTESTINFEQYSIIKLKGSNRDFQTYFLSLCERLILKIGGLPKATIVAEELNKIVSLFQYLSIPPKKTLQGLFGELTIIDNSKNPDYMIKAWHVKENSIHDFDNGKVCLEVKSSSTGVRKHTFSQKQLTPIQDKEIYIASLFIEPFDLGMSIFELVGSVRSKLTNLDTSKKLDEMVFKTLGNDFDKLTDVRYNYDKGIVSLQFYDLNQIPKILKHNIPSELSDIKYKILMEKLPSQEFEEFFNQK